MRDLNATKCRAGLRHEVVVAVVRSGGRRGPVEPATRHNSRAGLGSFAFSSKPVQ